LALRSAADLVYNDVEASPLQQTVNGFGRGCVFKGQVMMIRGQEVRVFGGAANAVRPGSIPAACAPALLIGGLLLLIGP
jgi:hypothetical protein